MDGSVDAPTLALSRGYVRVNVACHERYFGGAESIILLYEADEGRLWVLPVRSVRAGGFLLKLVNSRGDRAAAVHGFLRDHDIPEDLEIACTPTWDGGRQGIAVKLHKS